MIGDKIREIRIKKGLSINKLSKMSGVSVGYICDLENGKSNNPSENRLANLAKALGVETLDLVDDESRNNFFRIQKYYRNMPDIQSSIGDIDIKINSNGKRKISPKKLITLEQFDYVPLIGTVRAGEPILAEDNIERYIPISNIFISKDKEYFYLRVKGDSMDREFTEGTLLLIEKTDCVENGDIAIVLINGDEATVKKVTLNENMITLIPCSNNPKYIPKMYDIKRDQVRIIGRVKQAIKEY